MKINPDAVIKLHALYHRKEEGKYIIGNPETGEFMVLTPAEFRAIQLLHTGLTLKHATDLAAKEKDAVNVLSLLHELKDKGFVHKIGNRIITPIHEPLHEIHVNARHFGGATARFLLILISLFGLWTLIWRGWIPGPQIFFYQPSLSITLVYTIAMAWLLIAARQFFKYASAQHMNVPARFGFSTAYHLFIPKTYTARVTEQQEHKILGSGLLGLTALTSIALILGVYLPYPSNMFWLLTFAIGFIEILCEALLFLETDLAKFIALNANIYKLNSRTALVIKEDFKSLFGKSKPAHPAITLYAFFYILSIILGIILLAAYILPIMIGFLTLAFTRFDAQSPYFFDSLFTLLFFSVDLLLYGFALLKHHRLSHHTLFTTWSIIVITAATYLLATIGVQWFAVGGDTVTAVVLSFLLGGLIVALFHHAVSFAYPFTNINHVLRDAFLPIISACIPISILFNVQGGLIYIYALALGAGMLAAVSFTHMSASTAA